eukprot:244106-Rhodomonas_salina.1
MRAVDGKTFGKRRLFFLSSPQTLLTHIAAFSTADEKGSFPALLLHFSSLERCARQLSSSPLTALRRLISRTHSASACLPVSNHSCHISIASLRPLALCVREEPSRLLWTRILTQDRRCDPQKKAGSQAEKPAEKPASELCPGQCSIPPSGSAQLSPSLRLLANLTSELELECRSLAG